MGKPMIVVPNPTLADNHQEELATELESMQHLRSATVECVSSKTVLWAWTQLHYRSLPEVVEQFDVSEIKPFPPFDGSRFARVVDDALGFI
jgi:beta-1,4-N-acetylglucosaminyltransferase